MNGFINSCTFNFLVYLIAPLILYACTIFKSSVFRHIKKKEINPNIFLLFSKWNVTANFNYTTNWFLSTIIKAKKLNIGNWPSCKYNIRNSKQNSTPRDLVISSTFQKIYNVVPYVRTLRAVGCMALIMFLTDTIAANKLNTGKMPAFLEDFGVNVINVGIISGKKIFLQCLRNIIIHDFLKNRINEFDRVLIADMYDTIFQGDPFTKNIDRDKLGISEETFPLDKKQAKTLKSILGKSLGKRINKHKGLNAGTLIGGVKVIFLFLQSFVLYYYSFSDEERQRLENSSKFFDQVIANILIYCNISKLSYRFYNVNEDYFSCWYILDREFNRKIGNFTLGNKIYPLVIHLYDRIDDTAISICPQLFPQNDSYIRENYLELKYKSWKETHLTKIFDTY